MEKVYVAMSGGVDSSVSAALLREQGYDVTGVFIKTWHPPFLECTWKEERSDAMDVCAHLGIPFKTFDLEEEYKKEVVDYMISEYASGRTPNPDVMCNEKIKFGAFFTKAQQEGAQYIATGHYARVKAQSTKHKVQKIELLAGVDVQKDQSYFLWRVPRDVFEKVLFPVGELEKPEVRTEAHRFGLSVADKKDSQGVCFLGQVDMKEFLKRFIDVSSGDILDEQGSVIGTHEGAWLYTLGQRHGFTVTKKTPTDGPLYVVSKDVLANTLTVSQHLQTADGFNHTDIVLEHTNWISDTPKQGKKYSARFRYRQALQECVIEVFEQGAHVHFSKGQRSVALGQSLVVYDGEVCVGGGVVFSVA
ncbi:MAG: tRNA 2-thiouridine(34) synthase MnmA [Candidatus Campbellbacteria bacterium]|nr:tRNA 2-thiouridine(34) synthase MnmA [Candidatus Campbellbacteria bacterium]